MGGILRVSTPGGETNAVCVSGHFQPFNHIAGVFFAFQRPNHHAIPAVIGGDVRGEAFKRQLRAHGFRLLSAFKGAALDHPAAIVFFLRRGGFRRFFYAGYRRGGLGFRLRGTGMRWRLQQVLVRLLIRRRLPRLLLYRLRLLDDPRLGSRLLYLRLLLGLRELLLLYLLLS